MEKRLSNKMCVTGIVTDFFKYVNILLLLTTFLIVKYKLIMNLSYIIVLLRNCCS